MKNEESKQFNSNKGSQFNSVNHFGISSSYIKDRILRSKKNNVNVNGSSSSVSSNVNSSSNKGLPKDNQLNEKDSKFKPNIGKSLKNSAVNMAANKSEGVRKSVNAFRGIKHSVNALKVFIGVLASPVGWVIGIILVIIIILALIINSIGMLFGLTGNETLNIFEEEYKENMSTDEINELIENSDEELCKEGFFDKVKHFFGSYDLGDNCELAHYVKNKVEEKEKETGISSISPGYFMSVLYYAFDTQNADENGDNYFIPAKELDAKDEDDIEFSNDLDAITTLMSVKIYDKSVIDKLLDNYILSKQYFYYKNDCETDENGNKSCSCNSYSDTDKSVDENKLKLFLRYGEEVANEYESDASKLDSYNRTSKECLVNLNFSKPDLTKYETVANEEDNTMPTIKISSGTYGYDNGFIFKTFPRYDSRYIPGGVVTHDYLVDRDIEKIIGDVESRQDYTNYVLGYPSSIKNLLGDNIYSNGTVCTFNIKGEEVSDIKIRLLHSGDNSAYPDIDVFSPIEGEELIDFDKYILGVTYQESGIVWNEAIKAQAIMAATYVLNRPIKKENGQNIIEISNSTFNQTYCDPDKGCQICIPENYKNAALFTMGTLPSNAKCKELKNRGPIPEIDPNDTEQLKKDIRGSVKAVMGQLLYNNDGELNKGRYAQEKQRNWAKWAESGLDYVEILRKTYGSDTRVSSPNCTYGATGEWANWKQGSKEWGSMLIHTKTLSSVGCNITSYAMAIAKGSPQIVVDNFNPGTFLKVIKSIGANTNNDFTNPLKAIQAVVGPEVKVTRDRYIFGNISYNEKVNIISRYLSQGYEIVLQVKSPASNRINGHGDQHWAFVTGVHGNDILIADPATHSTAKVFLDAYINEGMTKFDYIKFD